MKNLCMGQKMGRKVHNCPMARHGTQRGIPPESGLSIDALGCILPTKTTQRLLEAIGTFQHFFLQRAAPSCVLGKRVEKTFTSMKWMGSRSEAKPGWSRGHLQVYGRRWEKVHGKEPCSCKCCECNEAWPVLWVWQGLACTVGVTRPALQRGLGRRVPWHIIFRLCTAARLKGLVLICRSELLW